MKKTTFIVVAMMLASSASMASVARKTALGMGVSPSTDFIDTLTNPGKVNEIPNAAVVEWGSSTAASTPKALGGFVRGMGESKMALVLGAENADLESDLSSLTSNGLTAHQNNPFTFMYGSKSGDMAWGVNFNYLSVDNKSTSKKLSGMGLGFGAVTSSWEAYLQAGLSSSGENGASNLKYTGGTGLTLGGKMNMDDMIVYLEYKMHGGKYDNAGTESKLDTTAYSLGVESFVKGTGSHFFYGAKYAATSSKNATVTTSETTSLPVYMGVEADATSWMTARLSLSQNVLIANAKASGTDLGTSTSNSTAVAAGAGLNFGNLKIDGTFEGSTDGSGDLDGVKLFSKVGMTYLY